MPNSNLYLAEPSKVVYRAKDGTEEKVFNALEWLAAMCSHIPDRGSRGSGTMGRYLGRPGLRDLFSENVIRNRKKGMK